MKESVQIDLNLQTNQRQSLIGQQDGNSRRFTPRNSRLKAHLARIVLMEFEFLSCLTRYQRL